MSGKQNNVGPEDLIISCSVRSPTTELRWPNFKARHCNLIRSIVGQQRGESLILGC